MIEKMADPNMVQRNLKSNIGEVINGKKKKSAKEKSFAGSGV